MLRVLDQVPPGSEHRRYRCVVLDEAGEERLTRLGAKLADPIGELCGAQPLGQDSIEKRLDMFDELTRVGGFFGANTHGYMADEVEPLQPRLVDDREVGIARNAAMDLDEIGARRLDPAHEAPRLVRPGYQDHVAIQPLAIEHGSGTENPGPTRLPAAIAVRQPSISPRPLPDRALPSRRWQRARAARWPSWSSDARACPTARESDSGRRR